MRKTLGYGFKLSNESIHETIQAYYGSVFFEDGPLSKNKKDVYADIESARRAKLFGNNAKPQIFRVVVEVIK